MRIIDYLLPFLKHPGRVSAWRGGLWLHKKLILLQERYGWYPYDRWGRRWMGGKKPLPVRHENTDTISGMERVASVIEDFGRSGTPKDWTSLLHSAAADWVGFWEQGDAIDPDLLKSLAGLIDTTPDVDVIYFDEDCFTGDSSPVYHSPFFKPDWSPELLISVNYVRHALFRRQVLLDGLSRVHSDAAIGLDDLIFLGCEAARKVVHLPGPFYHHRADRPDRSAQAMSPAGQPACPQAIAAHLERLGIRDPRAVMTKRGVIHACWKTKEMLVSIIIPTKDKVEYLERCIHSIQGVNHYPNYEVIVVDSGSQEEATRRYYDDLRGDERVRIIDYVGEFNYSRANNLGAQHARGDLLLFLNNDVEAIEPDWLTEMVQWAERPQIGIVGAKLLYPDGLIQHAGVVLGMEGHASHVFSGMSEGSSGVFGSVEWYRNYLAITAACMMMRKEVFESIGGFDEAYQLVFGDVEICVRAVEHGYRVVYNPFARLIHHEGKTRGRQMVADDIHKAFARFKARVAAGDPYYNRYLTHAVRTPALRREWEDDPLQRLERIVTDF